MEQDLLEAKKYLSQQGYGSGTNYSTNLVAVLLANYAQEKVKKLQQHSVMQAEGSDGYKEHGHGYSAKDKLDTSNPPRQSAEGAAVGQRSVGQNGSVGCFHCGKTLREMAKGCYVITCPQGRAEAPSEGVLH